MISFNEDNVRYMGLVEYPGYMVSDNGKVWSYWKRDPHIMTRYYISDTLTELKPNRPPSSKYYSVGLRNYKKTKTTIRIHVLILMAFIGPRPPGMQARHFPDRDVANNSIDNLKYGTQAEQDHDKIIHGTQTRLKGNKNPMTKLKETDIPIIRDLFAQGLSKSKLGRKFGVRYQTIDKLLRYKTWKHA